MTIPCDHPFELLTPDTIIDAIESTGIYCDGRVNALNSYENRVFQVGQEDTKDFLVAKFYRPNRWNQLQIQEEHDYCFSLEDSDISVIAPIKLKEQSIFEYKGFYFCLFPMKGGRAPELSEKSNLQIMARLLARMHNVSESKGFSHRPELNWQTFGKDSIDFVSAEFIPYEYKNQYDKVTKELENIIAPLFLNLSPIRTHGDLHIGNLLIRDDVPLLVDFDDSRMAVEIQDIWMLLSGDLQEQNQQLQIIKQAYESFRTFPSQQLHLIEPLRTLRMIHHCAWLARRWNDPAFHQAFHWFDSGSYWLSHINDLRIQIAEIQNSNFQVNT